MVRRAAAKVRTEQGEEAARIVTRVLGTEPAERSVAALGKLIERINARIARAEAEGKNVARAKAFVDESSALLATARDALAAGDPARALDYAMRGLDRIRFASAKHRTG